MNSFTRRRFLQYGTAAGAAFLVPWPDRAFAAAPTGVTPNLKRFVDRLPVPPVFDASQGGAAFTIGAGEATYYSFHSQLGPAKTWGYGGAPYLGPTINARRGYPVTVTWQNNLPGGTFLPNDPAIMGAVLPGDGPAPVAMHLHGSFSLPQFDGTPLQWFTRTGATGPHFISDTYVYGNDQRATMLWYHDHALGNTRTNVYAGLAGLYFVRDEYDTGLPTNPLGLPAGTYEVPLVLQDKTFNADGTMFYPSVGLPPHTVWVPEFFGDTPVVNGKAYPFLDVEPRRYRFRIVNGSQSRLYDLKLASVGGNFQLPFTVVGAEGGFLRAPVPVSSLLIAPGERFDVVVDFGARPKTTQWLLKNDAKAPFPMGVGGDVPTLMRLNVSLPLTETDATTPGPSLALPTLDRLPGPAFTREQPLFELEDPDEGNPVVLHLERADGAYLDASGLPDVTTRPAEGSVEDWLLVNTTGDTHPIHLHLVHFEVIDRRPFDAEAYEPGRPIPYTGPARPAPAVEDGRKDTVKAHPGEVTRIRAKFDLPSSEVVLPPGVTNPQYVWHCHILEHEENDMMRAFEVVR
jgi:spore coat protein A